MIAKYEQKNSRSSSSIYIGRNKKSQNYIWTCAGFGEELRVAQNRRFLSGGAMCTKGCMGMALSRGTGSLQIVLSVPR